MMKQIALAVSFLVAVTTSAQVSDSTEMFQAVQGTCSQLLVIPPTALSLQGLSACVKSVQDADLKAAMLAAYAMGLFCCDQAQDANKMVQYLKQAYPTTPFLALFQGSQYQANCPKCSGGGTVEGACSRCGGNGACKGCRGRGTIPQLNRAVIACKACGGSGKCSACGGSRRETAKCPQCFGKRQITSKDLMKDAYAKLLQQTKALALEHERAAKGLIQFEDQWVTPADRQKELDQREARAKAQQADAERKLKEAGQKFEEEARNLAEEKRKQAAAVAQDAQQHSGHGGAEGGDSLTELQALAENGNAVAQYKLGNLYDNGRAVAQDYGEAGRWYRKAADQGCASAQYNLGVYYANGQGVAKDQQAARGWLLLAAGAGNKDAAGALKRIEEALAPDQALETNNRSQEGAPVSTQPPQTPVQKREVAATVDPRTTKGASRPGESGRDEKGPRLYALEFSEIRTYSGSKGVPEREHRINLGKLSIGEVCINGAPISDSKSQEDLVWLREAAAEGYPSALNDLGLMHALGSGAPKDEVKAVELFQKAARRGNGEAWTNLKIMYEYSKGVPHDAFKAFEWFQKAALQGDPEAQTFLGALYAAGQIPEDPGLPKHGAYTVAKVRGSPQELILAKEWYQKAAMQGYAHAQYALGRLLVRYFPKEVVQAKAWYLLASKGGHFYAPSALHDVATGGTQAEIEQRAASLAATIAQNVKGYPQDEGELPERYQKLAMLRAFYAQFNLAFLYEYGIGVHKDIVQAVAWYGVVRIPPKEDPALSYLQAQSGFCIGDLEKLMTLEQRAEAEARSNSLLKRIYNN